MDVIFGIYMGNSTCSVAVNKDGNVNVVANAGGDRVTPAVVAVNEDEVVTGLAAKQGLLRNGPRTVLGVLRALAAAGPEDLMGQIHGQSCPPSWDEEGDVSYTVQTKTSTKTMQATNILRHLFMQIKDITSRHNAVQIHAVQCTACICLPAWASQRAVAATRDAAKQAGFIVTAVLLQPTAACLAYELNENRTEDNQVLTLHFGETSGVGALIEVSGGMVAVRDMVTTFTVAGTTLTNKLVEHLAKEFYMKYRGDPLETKRSRQKLYNHAEQAKHVLSTRSTAQVNVESLWEGVDFSCQVSRARFEGLISATLIEFLVPTLAMCARHNVRPADINKVVLSGGTCKVPRFQQLVAETFPSAEVLTRISPDEVLACGAAMEAAAVTRQYGGDNGGGGSTPAINGVNGTAKVNTPNAKVNGVNSKVRDTEEKMVNGKDAGKNANKKKVRGKERRKEVMRTHTPVLVSALAIPIWCKIGGVKSVCALPRLSPPHLRHSAVLLLPADKGDTTTLTVYEAQRPTDGGPTEEASILAQIKIPLISEAKELTITCQLKPDGSLQMSVLEPASKLSRRFVVSADADDADSS